MSDLGPLGPLVLYLFLVYFSTTGQAIEIGHRMEAKCTILNHFSQRYGKIPLITEDFTDDIGFSFDLMKVCIGHLKKNIK